MKSCPVLTVPNEDGLMYMHRARLQTLLQAISMSAVAAEHEKSMEHEKKAHRILGTLPISHMQKFSYMVVISLLCKAEVNHEIVEHLLLACPSASKMNEEKHMLPLHFALTNPQCNKAIICLLLQQHPLGACEPCEYGDTPLHLLVAKDSVDPVLLSLVLKACPKAIKCKNAAGKLPLHVAMNLTKNKAVCTSVVKILLQAYPEACMMEAVDDVRQLNIFTNQISRSVKSWTPMQRATETDETKLVNMMMSQLTLKGVKHRVRVQ